MTHKNEDRERLLNIANEESKIWVKHDYYKMAEDFMDEQWGIINFGIPKMTPQRSF
jgi:hypothetical protein